MKSLKVLYDLSIHPRIINLGVFRVTNFPTISKVGFFDLLFSSYDTYSQKINPRLRCSRPTYRI